MKGIIAGVDEVGRGPLAGPVVTAAVILDPSCPIAGLADSKMLSPARREALAEEIRTHALAWALGRAEVVEIDVLNILNAALLAMKRAVEALAMTPAQVWVDGNRAPAVNCPVRTIIGGDRDVAAISAASILAKVERDREMCEWDGIYHRYGFARHKGYPTREHVAALRYFGASPLHRHSFAPVKACLDDYPWTPLEIGRSW